MSDETFPIAEVTADLDEFLGPLIQLAGWHLTYEIRDSRGQLDRDYENPDILVDFAGDDLPLLLENKCELLLAIEHLAGEFLCLDHHSQEKIMFDAQEHRMMRFAELALAAQAAAEKVRRTGVPYKFGAMSGRERRVIHMALRGARDVRTESEGIGPYRHPVVHPMNSAKPARPFGRRR
jgi:spoIIIJ-associated protein